MGLDFNMSILSSLRPKPRWRHVDPFVRLVAVDELDDTDQDVLASIARNDVDARVRRIAVQRLDDPVVLAELSKNDQDKQVRQKARLLLLDLAATNSDLDSCVVALGGLREPRDLAAIAKTADYKQIRLAALKRLDDARLICNVASKALDASVRLDALSKLSEPLRLRDVAVKSEYKDVAIAAVERLAEEVEYLTTIVAKARVRAASRHAKMTLKTLKSTTENQDILGRQLELCSSLENLIHAEDCDQVRARTLEIESEWQEVARLGDPTLSERFTAAHKEIIKKLSNRARSEVSKQTDALAPRIRLCEEIELIAEQIREGIQKAISVDVAVEGAPPSIGLRGLEDVLARVDEVRTVWAALPPNSAHQGGALTRRFDDVCQLVEQRGACLVTVAAERERREKLCQEAERLAEYNDLREALHAWEEIGRQWHRQSESMKSVESLMSIDFSDSDLSSRFSRVGESIKGRQALIRETRSHEEHENLTRFRTLCNELEILTRADELNMHQAKQSARRVREALGNLGQLPSSKSQKEISSRLKSIKVAFGERIREISDTEEWLEWANVGVKEELCRRIETLIDVSDLEEVLKKLKEIQNQWAKILPTPSEPTDLLLRRFRSTQHQVRARCDSYFAQAKLEREENLARKLKLCKRAEELANASRWVRTAEEFKKIQAEWELIGPTSRRDGGLAWKKFRTSCDMFFSRRSEALRQRKAEWEENLKRKEQLCLRVESLQNSTDWVKTAAELKRIQADWKKTGPAQHRRSNAIWQRFRVACDAFFKRYQHRDELEFSTKLAKRDVLCRALEELLASDYGSSETDLARDKLVEKVRDIRFSWERLAVVRDKRIVPLTKRFEKTLELLVTRYPKYFSGTDLDPERNCQRLKELCEIIERYVDELQPLSLPNDESPAVVMARRWREAMASNTIAGKVDERTRWLVANDEVKKIKAEWKRVCQFPSDERELLKVRFEKACAKFADFIPSDSVELRRSHRHVQAKGKRRDLKSSSRVVR